MVPALDRYGHSLQDLITMVGELRKREIGFTSLHERLDTTTPGGQTKGGALQLGADEPGLSGAPRTATSPFS